jgi:hypothetical protein
VNFDVLNLGTTTKTKGNGTRNWNQLNDNSKKLEIRTTL